jgi:hypothetical protein
LRLELTTVDDFGAGSGAADPDVLDPGVLKRADRGPATARTSPTACWHDGRSVIKPFAAFTTSAISSFCPSAVRTAQAACPSRAAWARRYERSA